MIIVVLVIAVLVLGAFAAWAVGRADVPGVAAPVSTQSATGLPVGPVRATDVDDLRFDQAVRGYRMGQVDAALTRLAEELAERDAEIARLRGGDSGTTTTTDPQTLPLADGDPETHAAARQPEGLSR